MDNVKSFIAEINPNVINNPETEENRVNWILMNTALNGFPHDSLRLTDHPEWEEYNYYEEAMSWARSKDYFPNISDDEILTILRKYEAWNEFEKANHNA